MGEIVPLSSPFTGDLDGLYVGSYVSSSLMVGLTLDVGLTVGDLVRSARVGFNELDGDTVGKADCPMVGLVEGTSLGIMD